VSPAALHSLWMLAGLLFLDGLSFSFATTPLMLRWGQYHPAWQVAGVGSVASAAGSAVQLVLLRWVLAGERPWMRRLAPSRRRIEEAVSRHPSASFMALVIARATPLPDAPLKLAAAATGYPIPRYAAAVLLGGLPYYFVLALLGARFRFPVWLLIALVVVVLMAFAIDRLRQRGTPR
jgi:uncharacterized membrane protein YdjX (TVP38/TMEM64 family)